MTRRTVVKALASMAVAGGAMSWLEACASANTLPIQSTTKPARPTSPARPKLGTTLLTYYVQWRFKVDPIAWSPNGRYIASGYIAGPLSLMQIWDAETGKTLLSCEHGQNVYGLVWSPDSKRVASGCGDDIVRIWDAAHGDSLALQVDGMETAGKVLLIYKGHRDSVVGLAWSPDGTRIASGSIDTTVQVWSTVGDSSPTAQVVGTETVGKSLLTYRGHSDSVISVAWSLDGKRIASGSSDATVQVWEATTGKTLLTYKGHTQVVFGVAWSPDGTRIASASRDATVKVWDAKTGKTLLTYTGHAAPVMDVKWSPDGQRLVTGSGDTTVQVWEATTGKTLFTYEGHFDVVFDVGWSPDGTRVASASADTTVQVWQAV